MYFIIANRKFIDSKTVLIVNKSYISYLLYDFNKKDYVKQR